MTTTMTPLRGQILTFVLAGEEYGLDILRVREIIQYTKPTRVPGMPPAMRGLINLRGRVVPVVDLALRFGFAESVITDRTSIVIVDTTSADGEGVIGIITDTVTAVLELTHDQVQPPPSFGTSVGAEFLDGMADIGERRADAEPGADGSKAGKGEQKFIMLLNVDRAIGGGSLVPVET
jgi:purine-binding chemotaxis protein CheW